MRRIEKTLARWARETRSAKARFEADWSMMSLKAFDEGIYQRLREQQSLFDTACVTGTEEEIEIHGSAMLRGWAQCTELMNDTAAASAPRLCGVGGLDEGTSVLISHRRPPPDEVAAGTIWLSPDEVAYLINLPELRQVLAVKLQFPTADIQLGAGKF